MAASDPTDTPVGAPKYPAPASPLFSKASIGGGSRPAPPAPPSKKAIGKKSAMTKRARRHTVPSMRKAT